MVRYKLLKDLPRLKAGAMFKKREDGYYSENYYACFSSHEVEHNQDWFEETKNEIPRLGWKKVLEDANNYNEKIKKSDIEDKLFLNNLYTELINRCAWGQYPEDLYYSILGLNYIVEKYYRVIFI